jgi:S1-C subfamily serine protease
VSIHHGQIAFSASILFAVCILNLQSANAQYDPQQQCLTLIGQIIQGEQGSFERQISLTRQYLSYCAQHPEDYSFGLERLSAALNGSKQYAEALAAAERCIQMNERASYFRCTYNRAFALYSAGRVQDTKRIIEDALRDAAINTNDEEWKQKLRTLLRLAHACMQNNYRDCGGVDRTPQSRNERAVVPPAQHEVSKTGTGFFVSESGHIVTNAHVVEGCLTVRSSRGGQVSKVSLDEQSDLALYIASEKPKVFARIRGGRGAKAGEPVVAVGFPLHGFLSSDPVVTTGIISALSGLRNDRRRIQITAPVQPGNSGGPLLGDNGSVVGVVVAKLNAMKMAEIIGDIPQNVNFAVSLGTLQSFLNANDVPYLLDDNTATKSPADVAAEASHYTVLLECLR